MPEQSDEQKHPNARAWPTKSLFILMLVKDIDLGAAITDLVDNSLDGARRMCTDDDYQDLYVRITFSKDSFKIQDNCGGIDLDTAENYAFRFGRHGDHPKASHLVGEFGVGMKRALFKLGNRFRVESTTSNSRFVVELADVKAWSENDAKITDWEFPFTEYQAGLTNVPPERIGTTITVEELHQGIAEQLALPSFENRLIKTVSAAHQDGLARGLAISVQGFPLQAAGLTIKMSNHIKPAYREETFQEPDESPLTVKLYAGVAESRPEAAGWYVFCNGRLVLEADQTDTTVWGEMADVAGDVSIPRIHNQFARFRGYAFFDCDDSGRLPWNTTKNDVDADSAAFKHIRKKMVLMTRPVIDFLNELDREKDQDERPRERAVSSAPSVTLSNVLQRDTFHGTEAPAPPPEERMSTITYKKPYHLVAKVRQKLLATSNRDVGEKTFDYYLKYEAD